MGALGSGRPKTHGRVDECIRLDTSDWKKALRSPGKHQGRIRAENLPTHQYADGKAELGFTLQVDETGETGNLTLFYCTCTTDNPGQEQTHRYSIPLVTTPCNYGGQRWWMITPCCARRARTLYIAHPSMLPMCRTCRDLHYASQCASKIERQITYEKHLLRNYGYFWAYDKYMSLKKHYFDITPEYAELAMRSQYDRELYITKQLIETARMLINMNIRRLRYALKTGQVSKADKKTLFQYATSLELVSILKNGRAIERGILESNLSHALPCFNDLDEIINLHNDPGAANHTDEPAVQDNPVSDEALVEVTEAALLANLDELTLKRNYLSAKLKNLKKAA